MNNEDIEVGNKYRVKSWEDMLKIGHLGNSITFDDYDIIFLESMKHICGDIVTIEGEWEGSNAWKVKENSFIFVAPMLEELSKEELAEYNKPDLLTTLDNPKKYLIIDGQANYCKGEPLTKEEVAEWVKLNGFEDIRIFEVNKEVFLNIELN